MAHIINKIVFTGLLLINFNVPQNIETYQRPPTAREIVHVMAENYHVSEDLMVCLITKETSGTWNPDIQSGFYKNGVREESYGLAQIHIPSHPDITVEQAKDTLYAIEFMAKEISNGRSWEWTTLDLCQ